MDKIWSFDSLKNKNFEKKTDFFWTYNLENAHFAFKLVYFFESPT